MKNKTKYMMCTGKQYRENKLEIDNMSCEAVQSYKYLGSIFNRNNATEEEIKERLIAGNSLLRKPKNVPKQIIIKEI
jgi:hypothetical protein